MDNPPTQYYVSTFVMNVASAGISIFVSSWNAHPIPGWT